MRNLVSPILVDTAADLATFDAAKMFASSMAFVASMSATAPFPARYRFVAGATDTDTNQSQLIVVPGTNPASGKWVRCDSFVDLILPISFATLDEAVLLTVPANVYLKPLPPPQMFWEITAVWAGGVASKIGISFTNPALTGDPGALMGSAVGDGPFDPPSDYRGTTGEVWGATPSIFGNEVVLTPTSTIIFNRIVSAFTEGTGNVHAPCFLMPPIQTPQIGA